MKPYFILAGSILVMSFFSCTKQVSENIPPTEKKWVVTTLAGDGSASFADGPELSAKFHFPEDVVVTNDGTIFVTDGGNSRVRKIAEGRVSTFAGTEFGTTNGNGLSAKFKFPFSLALDASANMYISDVRYARIRKLTSAADVLFYAGTGDQGFADGKADTARFGEESRVVADELGNVFVADAQNNRIRKISVAGIVSTIAGGAGEGFKDGMGEDARFNFPDGIAMDKEGNLYVSDGGNYCIRKITPVGQVSVFAGSAGRSGTADGNRDNALFDYPTDITIDHDGNLYVLDINRVRKISPQGVVSTIAGSTEGYQDGDGADAKFFTPDGIGVDSQGNIYVADTNNNRIRKISFE